MDVSEGPRWPVARAMFPSAIKSFGQCPRRVRLMYIDQVEGKREYNIFLDKGIIAHDILRRQALLAQSGQPFLSEEWIANHALERLPDHEFSSPEMKQTQANDIVRWVRFGLRQIDREARFLVIERYEIEKWTLTEDATYSFGARPDVVMLRTDGDGQHYIEYVDYKTGQPYDDPITPLLTRSVFRKSLMHRLGDIAHLRTVFTWSWLDKADTQSIEIDREYYEYQWPVVSSELKRLINEREWPAQPSVLCNYCPFQGNHCDQGNGPFPSESWS